MNPPPHFVSLVVVFLGYAQTVATPPLICLLYGRISEALADGLGRIASSTAAAAATTGRRSRQRKKTGSSEVSINATPKTSISNWLVTDMKQARENLSATGDVRN